MLPMGSYKPHKSYPVTFNAKPGYIYFVNLDHAVDRQSRTFNVPEKLCISEVPIKNNVLTVNIAGVAKPLKEIKPIACSG